MTQSQFQTCIHGFLIRTSLRTFKAEINLQNKHIQAQLKFRRSNKNHNVYSTFVVGLMVLRP